MTLENLFTKLKGSSSSGNYGHAGVPGSVGGSAPGGGSGGGSKFKGYSERGVQSKAELSNILKKNGFSAARLESAGKVRGARGYNQAGYEIEFSKGGPRGNSAFIRVVTSTKRASGKVPTLDEIKKVLEDEGFNVKHDNWKGGGLDVK